MKLTILNDKGEVLPQCNCCGSLEGEMVYGPDPFASEIYGDYSEIFLCEYCHQSSCDDI
jgi:hypothetical protein